MKSCSMTRCRLPMTLSNNKQLGGLLLDTVLFTKDLNTMLDTLHWFLVCKYAQFYDAVTLKQE